MVATNLPPHNSAHTGGFGELCSASERITYPQAGKTSSSFLSADGRKRSNRGSSEDGESLTRDGLVSEDWRAGGPHLCTLPADWQDIPKEHPLYSCFMPGSEVTLEISAILERSKVATKMIFFCTRQSILDPAAPILTAVIAAKKRDISEDWLSVCREIRQLLHSKGLGDISLEINDRRASEPDKCYPIPDDDAIFVVWDQVLDTILKSCDIQGWNSVGCYRIGKHDKWQANPATVLVTVDTSVHDWRPSREAIISILDDFNLPMVAVKITRANIVRAASLRTSLPHITVQDTVHVGQSVGGCDYEGGWDTLGGWIELFNERTTQWRTFGLTCSHVALPNGAPGPLCLQVDSPSERDLDSQLREYDKQINNLARDIDYDQLKRRIKHGESSILPNEQRRFDRFTAMITSTKQKKLELELFRAGHKHHLGHVICASGTDKQAPSRTWADGSPTIMDWALIDVPERHKSNKLPIDGPGDSSLHNEGPSPKLQQQRILYKYGRASGYTEGRCSGIKHARIVNQIVNGWETRMITYASTVTGCQGQPFSLPGDIGALAVTTHLRVVGMVAANMQLWPITFITHADDIFADIKTKTGAGMVRVMGT